MHDTLFLGRIEVQPPLNEPERDYLADLNQSSSTLRGTPTGRGDADVPFAYLAWQPCETGCCLTWSGRERSSDMESSLRFLVDHLLGAGAKATGHRHFGDFTCDHVLDGTVVGRRYDDERIYVAEVSANAVGGRSFGPACEQKAEPTRARACPPPTPSNVIELRPRGA